ncbi:hypothetical protein ETAA8_32000 [Anatilimnocola aggregata]|uniref:Uncharacterized protein n=1 Tax=Anatilimnocola aggregata TaxID=2528021 RepID=A0A517YCY6_9BACT|nr:hypothetical protein [Anatilimnocola aggregata]QDU28107.1 hypothetical protein ETAA8_32000 [Anatilimnocola aggregata]
MATGSAPKTVRKGKPTPIWMKILLGTLGLFALGLTATVVVWMFGSVYGTEICAESLERRSYFFLEIPLIRLQVRGIEYSPITNDLAGHLATSKLVSVPAANKKTWHSITSGRGVLGLRTGDPEILVRYLEAKDANSELAWLAWTKDNPKLAAPIWKGVTDLALAGEYTTIPDVLELTQSATDVDKTTAAVGKVVSSVIKKAAPKPGKSAEPKADEKKQPAESAKITEEDKPTKK